MSTRFRFVLGVSLCMFFSASAFAQYAGPGGTGAAGTGGTTGTRSYGNGAAIGAGAGAAVAGAVIAYMVLHKTTLVGCVEQATDGIKMLNEKDKKTYAIDAGGQDVKPGQRVEVKGKTSKGAAGLRTLHVKAVKDLGSCSPAQAEAQTQPQTQ